MKQEEDFKNLMNQVMPKKSNSDVLKVFLLALTGNVIYFISVGYLLALGFKLAGVK